MFFSQLSLSEAEQQQNNGLEAWEKNMLVLHEMSLNHERTMETDEADQEPID